MRTLTVNGLRLVGARTAIGRHLEYLAQHWSSTAGPFDRVEILVPATVRLEGLGDATPVTVRVVGKGLPPIVWEQVTVPLAARRSSALFSEYSGPIVVPTAPALVANHGIYEALPETFSRVRRFRATAVNRWSARRARRVVANSTNTRDDLVRYLGVEPAKIDVVLPGPADVFFRAWSEEARVAVRAEITGGAPYILFVGKFSRRRHVDRLVDAFARVKHETGLPHHLVLVGPDTTGVRPIEQAASLGVADAVVHEAHADHERLARIYAAADLFVLPSEYEGLSWTMLEAMASVTAVLTVEHATVAEAAGDTVATVPEPTVPALAAAMRELLGDPDRRAAIAAAGRRRAERFSMRASAIATTEVLDRVALTRDPGPDRARGS
jgi:glycosyltransferase involved in cell wall biosynthesis